MFGFSNRPRRVTSPRRMHLSVGALEDRRLLATFNPLISAVDGGPNSLRSAVISADEDLQDNTIILQAGVYQLTSPNTAGHENGAAQGDLNLTSVGHTVTIQGQGAGVTIIDGGGLDRIFEVMNGVTAIFRGLTIRNGLAQEAGNAGTLPDVVPGFGGGILNLGTTTLDHVNVENNIALGGPGKDGVIIPTAGITRATGGLSGLGGGIFNGGVLTLTQSIVRDNSAEGGTGGSGAPDGDVQSSGGNGGSAFGGGIYNAGPLTISQSLIATNHADAGAGGDAGNNDGDQSLGNNGGNGGDAFGGGIYIANSSAAMIDSTIAGNDAHGGTGGQGGMGGQGGNPLTNPGSMGGGGGNGGNAKGGGIAAESPFSIYNTTVAANRTFSSFGGNGGPGASGNPNGFPGNPGYPGVAEAGGIWAPVNPDATGLLTSVSSLIALNFTTQFVAATAADNPSDVEATFASATNTLLQTADSQAVGIANGMYGDIVGVDPKIGPLQDNGGATPTMALLPGSPAIDTGSNPLGLTSDQRGFTPRTVGAGTDIGAFEFGATAPAGGGNGGGGGGGGGGITSAPPTIIGEKVLITRQHNKRGKPVGKARMTGFEIDFSTAMNSGTAGNPNNYQVAKFVTKRVKRKLVQSLQAISVPVSYNPSNNSVTLAVAGSLFTKGGQITVSASPPGGITSASGVFLDGRGTGAAGTNAVLLISPRGTGISSS